MQKERSCDWAALALLCAGLSACVSTPPETAHEARLTNSIGMEFVLIKPGSFTMGSAKGRDNEKPPHPVTITQAFYLGKYEVTQAQWETVMGRNPSLTKGRNYPVENVSWDDAQVFIKWLNLREGTNKYRLPTEAEWEYAARAGTTTAYSFGEDASSLGQYAWYRNNSGVTSHPVGEKRLNPWGLHDMHGNVWEWVQDLYDPAYYDYSTAIDPPGPGVVSKPLRVLRGGGWFFAAESLQSSYRYPISGDYQYEGFGFRVAMAVAAP